jgi:membrane protein
LTDGGGGTFTRLRSRLDDLKETARQRARQYPGVRHLLRAYRCYLDNRGNHLAAAVTYFSFLALFPLILLGASVAGFILAGHPNLADDLYSSITRNVPGDFGDTVVSAIKSGVNNRTKVGIIGVAGLLVTGLGWIANLRTAIDTVWGLPRVKRPFLSARLHDLAVLLGLAAGILISLGLTAFGTEATGPVLRWLHLNHVGAVGVLTSTIAIVLGVIGGLLIFGWLIIRLPQVRVSRRVAIIVTLMAAAGFEVFKLAGTLFIDHVIRSPAAAAIGPIVGVLVWMNLLSRYLLYCVAWAATAEDAETVVGDSECD